VLVQQGDGRLGLALLDEVDEAVVLGQRGAALLVVVEREHAVGP
jgi:hypothetical protein